MYGEKPGVLEMGILEDRVYQTSPIGTVGLTQTKTAHFSGARPTDISPSFSKVSSDVDDSSIKRNFIANIAEENYLVSSTTDADSKMHKMVLGERLNKYLEKQDDLIRSFVDVTSNLLNTVQVLFESYLDHEHAIPEINIDIPDKVITDRQTINLGFRTVSQPSRRVFVPATRVRVPGSGDVYETVTEYPANRPPQRVRKLVARGTPGSTITVPSKFITVPSPPKTINLGYRVRTFKRRIKFDDISIGGPANPRFTVPIETDTKTTDVQNGINSVFDQLDITSQRFVKLVNLLDLHLSRRNFLN